VTELAATAAAKKERRPLHEFSDQLERLFIMMLLVLFGGALAGGLLAPLTWGAAAAWGCCA
jgi:hypothetical protein